MKTINVMVLLFVICSFSSCISEKKSENPEQNQINTSKNESQLPEGSTTVETLMIELAYEEKVQIYGQIKDLGRLNSTAFFLTFNESKVRVWYDMMLNNDESSEPKVNVDKFESGDWVVITGTLKKSGNYVLQNDFWAKSIQKQ